MKGEAIIDGQTPYEDDLRAQAVVSAHPEGLTYQQIGELLGVQRQRAEQIVSRAAEKLLRRAKRGDFALRHTAEAALEDREPIGSWEQMIVGGR